MSIWSEMEPTTGDPFDPTSIGPVDDTPAPVDAGDDGREHRSPLDAPAPATEEGEDGEVSDPSGAVHVRLGEDGLRVVEVRISTRWRERLKQGELATALMAACARAQRDAPRPGPTTSFRDDLPTGARRARTDRTVDWAGLARMREETRQLREESSRLRALPESERRRPELLTPPAEGSAAGGRVRVVLAPSGVVGRVEVDREWSRERARIVELTEAVEQAFRAAYDAWTPARYSPGDTEPLMTRYRQNRRALMALISRREN